VLFDLALRIRPTDAFLKHVSGVQTVYRNK
jgi:hypothetical protein